MSHNTFNYLALPNFSCQYCGVHEPRCVVQCTAPHCFRWFCNTKYPNQKKCHYLMHAMKSRHRSISDFNNNPFRCKCGLDNIFELKMSDNGKISCFKCIFREFGYFNRKRWSPFIRENRLPYGWVDIPTKLDYSRMIILKTRDIKALEEMWKKGYRGRFEELQEYDERDEIMRAHKAKDLYETKGEYIQIMLGLLELHEQDDQERTQDYYQENVQLKWFPEGTFQLIDCSNYDYFSGYLRVGSYLQVSFHRKTNYLDVRIINIDNDKNIIKCGLLVDSKVSHTPDRVDVRALWMNIPYRRMANAINDIQFNHFFLTRLHSYFWKNSSENSSENSSSYGDDQPETAVVFKSNSKLNESQKKAITSSSDSAPLTLIQGPPGTGKTFTLYEIIYRMHLLNINKKNKMKILFCAPSNIAVDNLALKLKENNIDLVRVYSALREKSDDIEEKLSEVALHQIIFNITGIKRDHFLKKDDYEKYKETENQVLSAAEIIGCTCSGAGDERMKSRVFDYVIIDEAAQALEMETLIPISRCSKKLILCGDHKQLGPLVFSHLGKSLGLSVSLFERLAKILPPVLLETQYRMHEKIAEFPSLEFYNGKIKTGVKREIIRNFPWPDKKSPQLFCHIKGKEEIGPNGSSFLNRDEAHFIKTVVVKLIQVGVKPENIGIITPYLAQKFFLSRDEHIRKEVQISSVDGFQGKEKDYILISCVRSNEDVGIGFLSEINRINVAITRARYGMVICGNEKTLRTNPDWKKLLDFYKEKKVMVTGEEIDYIQIY